MRIFITGIGGFIGSALAERLAGAGHTVGGSISGAARRRVAPPAASELCELPLAGECAPSTFAGFDAVLHCAHDFRRGREELNLAGTTKLMQAAREGGVRKQLFISSATADPDSRSSYGRTKYELERRFLSEGHMAVRPGLVIGNGGLCGRMIRLVDKLPVLPLIDGGNGFSLLIAVDDLTLALQRLLVDGLSPRGKGPYQLFNRERVRVKELLSLIRESLAARTLLLPVPRQLLLGPLVVAEWLGLTLPISRDNVLGYQQNQQVPGSSDLEALDIKEAGVREMVGRAVSRYQACARV